MEPLEERSTHKKVTAAFALASCLFIIVLLYSALFARFAIGIPELVVSSILLCLAYLTKGGNRFAYRAYRISLWIVWVVSGCVVSVFLVIGFTTKFDFLTWQNDPQLPMDFEHFSHVLLFTAVVYATAFATALTSYLLLLAKPVKTYFGNK